MFALFIFLDGSNSNGKSSTADSVLHQAEEMELMRKKVVLCGVVGSELQKMFLLQTVNHHRESQMMLII